MEKPIGALWKKVSGRDVEYLSGEINGQRVVVFKNKYYRADDVKQKPYFNIYDSQENPNYQKTEVKDVPIKKEWTPIVDDDFLDASKIPF